ncbi:DUF887-domain-containing protein [Pisolithus croceorrhizus]|nr:DUF887-domain-containing protein [Pisolithus croceorrhizus]
MMLVQDIRSFIRDSSRPIAEKVHLHLLPDYSDIMVISALFFFTLHHTVSPVVSRVLFPVSYGKANRKTRNNWDAHVVSLVHAALIVALSLRCLDIPTLSSDRAFGFHKGSTFVSAIACGYFIWDATEAIVHYTEFGFVLHGIACFSVFMLGSRPFAHYHAVRFLFWEVSTIFLNIHWFLDKTGKTGSVIQLINGVVLLGTFASVRLIWGGIISYDFLKTLRGVSNQLPFFYVVVYGSGNVMLNLLNWFWFTKMIASLRKRFSNGNGNANGNGIHHKGNGDNSLEHKEF